MSQPEFSVADLARSFDDLKSDSRIVEVSAEELSGLEQPKIYTPVNARAPSRYTFENHWKHVRVRFSKENREKVEFLWNTRFRTLILNNIRSNYDVTLREELSSRSKYTPKEAKIGRYLSKNDSESRRVATDLEYHETRKAKDRERWHRRKARILAESHNSSDTTAPEESVEPYVPREVQFSQDASSLVTSESADNSQNPQPIPEHESIATNDAENDGTDTLDQDSAEPEAEMDDNYDYGCDYGDYMDMDDPDSHSSPEALEQLSDCEPEDTDTEQLSEEEFEGLEDEYANPVLGIIDEDENDSEIEECDIGDGLQVLDGADPRSFNDFYDSDDDFIPEELFASPRRRRAPPGTAYCSGHTFDRFGVRQKHDPKFCRISAIERHLSEAGNTMSIEQAIQGLSLTHENETNRDVRCSSVENQKLTIDMVKNRACLVDEYRVNVQNLVNTNSEPDMLAFARNILEKNTYRFPYEFRFHKAHSFRDGNKVSLYFHCCNFARSKEVDRQNYDFELRGIRAFTPLQCKGVLRFTFSKLSPVLIIKHIHKHHINSRVPRVPTHTREAIERSIKISIEQGSVFLSSKRSIVDMILNKFPGVEYSAVSKAYDRLVNAEFNTDRSDFRSLIRFCEAHSEDYAYFTFYSGKHLGLAIMLKKMMSELSVLPEIESVALDATYNISKHKCEMFIANATVDRTGIPFGYMFVNKTEDVQISLEKLGYAKRAYPLPQCDVAIAINDLVRRIFPRNDKSLLTACFLMLFRGTCNDMGIAYSEDGKHIKMTPLDEKLSHDFSSESICKMKAQETYSFLSNHQILPPKILQGLKIALFTCDKDVGQINVIEAIYPESLVSIYSWHNGKSLRMASTKVRRKPSPTLALFFTGKFPNFMKKYSPALFNNNEPHSPENCPYSEPSSSGIFPGFVCAACHPEKYSTWSEPPLASKHKDNYDASEADTEDQGVNFSDLWKLWQEHSRCHPSVPQIFANIRKDVTRDFSKARYYNADELYEFAVCEVVEFCLSHRLLRLLEYLYKNWYDKSWFCRWSQCFHPTYTPFTTNTISEGFNSLYKSTLGRARVSIRLDKVMWIDYNALYPKQIRKLDYLKTAISAHSYENSYEYLETSWTKRRWTKIRSLKKDAFNALDAVDPVDPEYQKDCITYATNAMTFQCGCFSYKKENIHLCKHIMKCIDPISFYGLNCVDVKINLRARPTAPFYVTASYSNDESRFREYIWDKLTYKADYHAFWESVGKDIVLEKGGYNQITLPPPNPIVDIVWKRKRKNTTQLWEVNTDVTVTNESLHRLGSEGLKDILLSEHCTYEISPTRDKDTVITESYYARLVGILRAMIKQIGKHTSTVNTRSNLSTSEAQAYHLVEDDRVRILNSAIENNFFDQFYINSGKPPDENILKLLSRYKSSYLCRDTLFNYDTVRGQSESLIGSSIVAPCG